METILFIIGIIGLFVLYASFTFVKIPINHLVMVEINGKPEYMLGHSSDVERMRQEIETINDPAIKERLTQQANAIITRDKISNNILFFWLVPLCNLHFKHWNPFATLRKVKVIRTEENPEYDPTKKDRHIRDYIINKDSGNAAHNMKYVEVPELRIRWRRVGISPGRDMKNYATVDFAWSFSEVMIVDPYYIFITSSNPNQDFDNQVGAALNNVTTTLTDSEFQEIDSGANPKSPLNNFFKEIPTKFGSSGTDITAGLISIGIRVTGAFSINDYMIGGDNVELLKANSAKAAATANLEVTKIQAQGNAAEITARGLAEAEVITKKGEATAGAAKALRKAIASDPLVATILETKEYGGNVQTLIKNPGPTGVIVPANQAKTETNS